MPPSIGLLFLGGRFGTPGGADFGAAGRDGGGLCVTAGTDVAGFCVTNAGGPTGQNNADSFGQKATIVTAATETIATGTVRRQGTPRRGTNSSSACMMASASALNRVWRNSSAWRRVSGLRSSGKLSWDGISAPSTSTG